MLGILNHRKLSLSSLRARIAGARPLRSLLLCSLATISSPALAEVYCGEDRRPPAKFENVYIPGGCVHYRVKDDQWLYLTCKEGADIVGFDLTSWKQLLEIYRSVRSVVAIDWCGESEIGSVTSCNLILASQKALESQIPNPEQSFQDFADGLNDLLGFQIDLFDHITSAERIWIIDGFLHGSTQNFDRVMCLLQADSALPVDIRAKAVRGRYEAEMLINRFVSAYPIIKDLVALDPSILNLMNAISLARMAQDWEQERSWGQQFLEVSRAEGRGSNVAHAHMMLGHSYSRQKEWKQAQSHYDDATTQRLALLGTDQNPFIEQNYVKSVQALVGVMQERGQGRQARKTYAKALEAFGDAYGDDSLEYAWMSAQFAQFLIEDGQEKQARAQLEASLEIAMKSLPEDNQFVGQVKSALEALR